jgi:hypothetical protein
MIFPDEISKLIWDIIMLNMIIITCLQLPYQIAFLDYNDNSL